VPGIYVVYFKILKYCSLLLDTNVSRESIYCDTNSFCTKFLGVTMNNTLPWNNHIDLLVKKLSKACSIIRNAKTYMSAPSLKMIYYAFFTQLWAMELYSGETRGMAP